MPKRTKLRKIAPATEKPAEAGKSASSAFINACISEFRKQAGNSASFVLGDQALIPIGLELPAFCLRYLFGCNILPLGRIYQIVGLQGTMKSALTFEIARWFRALRGAVLHLEHETKFNPDYARSILGWDDEASLVSVKCRSVNDWQRYLLAGIDLAKKQAVGGKLYPVLFIVDSVMAKALEETQDRIDKTGYADRGFPAEAMSITRFMRQVPQKLDDWPFVLLLTNHLKPSRDERGFIERHKAGGRGIDFQESAEIEISRSRQWRLERTDRAGRRFDLVLYKNALGPDMRKISVEVWWWFEDDPANEGEYRQVTVWDWHAATTQLLMSPPEHYKRRTSQIINFTPVRKPSGILVASDELGISAKSPVSMSEAGRLIMENKEILAELERLYGVARWRVYCPGVDYDAQVASEKRAAAARASQSFSELPTEEILKDGSAEEGKSPTE